MKKDLQNPHTSFDNASIAELLNSADNTVINAYLSNLANAEKKVSIST